MRAAAWQTREDEELGSGGFVVRAAFSSALKKLPLTGMHCFSAFPSISHVQHKACHTNVADGSRVGGCGSTTPVGKQAQARIGLGALWLSGAALGTRAHVPCWSCPQELCQAEGHQNQRQA